MKIHRLIRQRALLCAGRWIIGVMVIFSGVGCSSSPQPHIPAGQPTMSFSAIDFSGAPEQYKSQWTNRAKVIELTSKDGGLQCEATPSDSNCYGGVTFRTTAPRALRLDMTFLNPKAITTVYVYGYGPARKKVLHWSWKTSEGAPDGNRHIYTLVPGKSAEHFRMEEFAGLDSLVEIDVFTRVEERAGFILHRAEVAH